MTTEVPETAEPGQHQHEFVTKCIGCGEPGMLNIAIIGYDQMVKIVDYVQPYLPVTDKDETP